MLSTGLFLVLFAAPLVLTNGYKIIICRETDFKDCTDLEVESGKCSEVPDAYKGTVKSSNTRGQCVFMYDKPNCKGRQLKVAPGTPDHQDLRPFDKAQSVFGCHPDGSGNGGDATIEIWDTPPEIWKEDFRMIDWHNNTLKRTFYNDDIALYIDEEMDPNKVKWAEKYLNDAFRYMKRIYGSFGPDKRLYGILHNRKYRYATIANQYDRSPGYKSIIDCGPLSWDRDGPGEIDFITHELAHIVEGSSKGVRESPSFQVWGDSQWAEIFQYDVYKATNRTGDQKRWYDKMMKGSNWFREWFYPIYRDYGEASVLNKYFETLAKYFPKKQVDDGVKKYPMYTRRMNFGEFVHFFSGTTGQNLKSLATKAFGWDEKKEGQFTRAQRDFPELKY